MNILHTSDWHLGHTLYGNKRYDETESFLKWLVKIINDENIDLLIVSGDIFDTATPSNKAMNQLYTLYKNVLAGTKCSNIVITGGNHDSPSLLDAPAEVLKSMNIHIVGKKRENTQNQVILIKNKAGTPECIVCAVPFLREREIRYDTSATENFINEEFNRSEGIKKHYHDLFQTALRLKKQMKLDIPVIMTGHLFVEGGKTAEGDGVRELYVGNLEKTDANIFPEADYIALGHLHSAQRVNGKNHIRYSGSPLAMSFSDAETTKFTLKVIIENHNVTVKKIPVPVFKILKSLSGNLEKTDKDLKELTVQNKEMWIEINFEGNESPAYIRKHFSNVIENSELKILRIKNSSININFTPQIIENIDELDEKTVFEYALDSMENLSEEEKNGMFRLFDEILINLKQRDINENS